MNKILFVFVAMLFSQFAQAEYPALEKDLQLQIHGSLNLSLATQFADSYAWNTQRISYVIVAAKADLRNASDFLLVNGAIVTSQTIRAGLLDYTYLQINSPNTWADLSNSNLEFHGDLFVDSISVVFQ